LGTVMAFLIGLPFGPAGVGVAYSACCLLFHLPANFYFAGRSGPVNTRDLWGRFLTHLPIWGVVSGITFLSRSWVEPFAPVLQVLICVPLGLLAGCIFVWLYPPSRRVVLSLVDALRD